MYNKKMIQGNEWEISEGQVLTGWEEGLGMHGGG